MTFRTGQSRRGTWGTGGRLTTLGDSGFCSWLVTCDPARLRRRFTLMGVASSAGQSGRFAEGREAGAGVDGERNRLRGRQQLTGCRTETRGWFITGLPACCKGGGR